MSKSKNRAASHLAKQRMARARTFPERLAVVIAARREANLSVRQLAELSGLAQSTIQNMDQAGWSPTIRTVAAIERVLIDRGVI